MQTSLLATAVTGLASLALAGCGGELRPKGAETVARAESSHALVGRPAPRIDVDSINGQGEVSRRRVNGKVVIIDFWATWCEACKASLPRLQELSHRYKQDGLEIVAISEDDDGATLAEFAKELGPEFPVVWDDEAQGKRIARTWKPTSMPASFIIDREGVVRFAHAGYGDDDDDLALEGEVRTLLHAQPAVRPMDLVLGGNVGATLDDALGVERLFRRREVFRLIDELENAPTPSGCSAEVGRLTPQAR